MIIQEKSITGFKILVLISISMFMGGLITLFLFSA